jgi:hypothetical protein
MLRVQENQEGLKLNVELKFLAYGDENVLGENIDTTQKVTEALLDDSKEVVWK